MSTLIINGTIVNEDGSEKADILIEEGKILKIGAKLQNDFPDSKLIDAKDRYIFPGGIDSHVHMHLPSAAGFSADDFKSGSLAALKGGTTSIIDFVTPKKGQNLQEALQQRKQEAEESFTYCSFHMSPIEWRDSMQAEIEECAKSGIKSFKVYLAYKDSIGLNDDVLFKVMQSIGKVGGVLLVHCEMGDDIDELIDQFFKEGKTSPFYHPLSRPAELEAQAVKKAIEFAAKTNCTLYIVHVSSKESLKHIRKAQNKGQKVYAESCPQYLLLDDSRYDGPFEETAAYVMSPPLRKKADNDALWLAIQDGEINTIATDHCPFNLSQKKYGEEDFRKIPNGAGGVEHRIALLYTYGVLEGKISLNQLVKLTSTNPAKIFGLYPQKGLIAEGSDADLVIWNPNSEEVISSKTHYMNCDLNIYEGIASKGFAEIVILAGRVVLENDNLSAESLRH